MRGVLVGVSLCFAALLVACTQADNLQYLPIGTRCTQSEQCGTNPYFCHESGYPGGYCEKPCTADGDCPSDSVCAVSVCRRKCTNVAQCRADEGYTCKAQTGVTTNFCELAQVANPMDAGTTD